MNSPKTRPVIGLIGGVGSGKSTVAAELAELGCAVIDADAVGHEVIQRDDVKGELRRLWGDGVFDESGAVDRSAVAQRVFADPDDLLRLNAVMHPLMRAEFIRRIDEFRGEAAVKAIVLDAAVLLEAGWDDLCTTVVFVDASEDVRRVRAEARGWGESSWRRRENSQKPLDMKRSKAEYIVDNSSSLASLRESVRSLFHTLLHPTDCPKDS